MIQDEPHFIIDTNDKDLISKLESIQKTEELGVYLYVKKDFSSYDFTSFVITYGGVVGLNLISSYIYDSLKRKSESETKINNERINNEMNKTEIGQIINSNVIINQTTGDETNS